MRLYDLCLINPPCPDLVHPHAQIPLGELYLGAVADADGLDVTFANLAGAGLKPGRWRLPLARVYGISGTFLHIAAVNALAAEIKRRNRAARVLVGGAIALSRTELDMRHIDTVVFGEGENVVADLVRRPGPRYIEGSPADLAALPMPARHLWAGPFGGNVFIGGRNYFGGGNTTLLTSRGCPFSCAFCAGPALTSRRVRFRDPISVVEEMERVVIDFGVRQFRLSDEYLTCNREHVTAICDGIRRSEILGGGERIAWRASVGSNPHDVEMFEFMRAAGCREIALGVESADPRVLELVCRKTTPERSRAALANARAAGINTRALMMVGLPGETAETARLNREFIVAKLCDAIAITVFVPVPGCEIRRDPLKFGCRLRPDRAGRSLCIYGADGKSAVEPTIEIEGMSVAEHAQLMAEVIGEAEQLGLIGKG